VSIRVLIGDDHPVVRDGLRFCINRWGADIEIVGEASDGTEVLHLAKKQSIDIFIIDIAMPLLNGLDTTRALLREHPTAKVIILSFHKTRSFVEEAMRVGARGYLTKETASQNIVEAIREVAAGRFYLSPDIAQFMVEFTGHGSRANRGIGGLTARERRVLQLTAEGKTAKEIASLLSLATNTVHAHRKNLMTKLDVHKQTDLVRIALREGIIDL
jgi:two-component system NarL family response regulator